MRELLRVIAGLLAVALLGYPFTLTGLSRGYVALVVPVGLLVLSGLLLWSETALTLAAAALVFPYAVAVSVEERPVDLLAPVAAALLLVFVHVADAAIATLPRTPVDRVFLRRLALDCATRSASALGVGAAVLAVSAVSVPDSQPLRAVGLAAAAVALVVPVHLLTAERAQRRRNLRRTRREAPLG
ncbi:MAG TPA: hypothetical protein VNA14_05945 [Mycobacteriales bacterium]|nr:hypothetical protein [Mycobacteriales bacterium]